MKGQVLAFAGASKIGGQSGYEIGVAEKETGDETVAFRNIINAMADRVVRLHVGVLAIQGAFFEHRAALLKAAKTCNLSENVDVEVKEVREPSDLENLDGLVLPGGESTTMSIFLRSNSFEDVLREWVNSEKKPHVTWGTCAGMILLSNQICGQKIGGQVKIGGLDITTSRNFFGRQVSSFEGDVTLEDDSLCNIFQNVLTKGSENIGHPRCQGVFIRAPAVVSVDSPQVKVLATVKMAEKEKPVIVGVQQGNLIATAFHPELTEDPRWHAHFLQQILQIKLES